MNEFYKLQILFILSVHWSLFTNNISITVLHTQAVQCSLPHWVICIKDKKWIFPCCSTAVQLCAWDLWTCDASTQIWSKMAVFWTQIIYICFTKPHIQRFLYACISYHLMLHKLRNCHIHKDVTIKLLHTKAYSSCVCLRL